MVNQAETQQCVRKRPIVAHPAANLDCSRKKSSPEATVRRITMDGLRSTLNRCPPWQRDAHGWRSVGFRQLRDHSVRGAAWLPALLRPATDVADERGR